MMEKGLRPSGFYLKVKITVSSFYWPPNNPVWRFEPLIEIATS